MEYGAPRDLRNTGHTGHTGTATEVPHLLHADITAPILDSFRYLYREWGYGFLETPYRKGLVIELALRGLSVRQEVPFEIVHRGVVIGEYRADMVVEDRVLVEVKATRALTTADERQLLNYLKASKLEVGLILHFGPEPKVVRRLLTHDRH
jgi:GxxExxY protein